MTELPIAPVKRIFKNNTDMKISKEALQLFAEALENEAQNISAKAVELAKKDGRKTIQERDIRRWKPYDHEDPCDDFIYTVGEKGYYSKKVPINAFVDKSVIRVMPVKFLEDTLLFRGKLYKADSIGNAKSIMESFENAILESLKEPHWAYNIYEFRDWEDVEEIGDNIYKLTMWFDDYDGGDVFVDGILFHPQH